MSTIGWGRPQLEPVELGARGVRSPDAVIAHRCTGTESGDEGRLHHPISPRTVDTLFDAVTQIHPTRSLLVESAQNLSIITYGQICHVIRDSPIATASIRDPHADRSSPWLRCQRAMLASFGMTDVSRLRHGRFSMPSSDGSVPPIGWFRISGADPEGTKI